MHARQRDHVSCRKATARAVAVDLHDGVAAALGNFDKITDVSGLRIQRCHAVDVAGFAVSGVAAALQQFTNINAIGVGGAFPCPYRKTIHHVRAVAASGVAGVEQFIEQSVVTAVADVERVVTAAPFQLVIARAAGQSVVKIRAGNAFDIGKCRGVKTGGLAAELLKLAVTPTVDSRKSTTSIPPFASQVPVPELYTQPPEPS